jgi:hypothetical protein
MHLSIEAWSHVCLQLDASPRKVFMLMCTIHGLHSFISGNETWWKAYWTRHQKLLSRGEWRRHWYLRTDAIGILRPVLFEHVLKLVYSTHCSMCSCRYGHSINHHLKLRICRTCKQDHFISNAVLYFEYGIEFTKIIKHWEPFVKFLPLHDYKPAEIITLSRNPIDVAPSVTREMVFFWLPDIASLYDMPALRAEQAVRVAKLNTIKAAVKRRFAQAHKPRHLAEILYRNETTRVRKPLLPAKWCVGGPQSMAWRCHASRESATMAQTAERRTLRARLMLYHPVPILASNEYVLKTAVGKLKLDAKTLIWKKNDWDMPDSVRYPYSRKVYTIKE